MSTSPVELAKYYSVDDLTSATTGGGRLNNLLLSVSKGRQLSILSQQYLESKGLNALLGFLTGALSKGDFYRLALLEQEQRIATAKKQQLEFEAMRIAEQKAVALKYEVLQAQYEAEQIKRESDPKFIARRKNQELRRKFGIEIFVEKHYFKQLMQILRTLDAKSRLSEIDFIWLKTKGGEYQTDKIWHAYHRIEADFYISEYQKFSDPWQAVNASAHLRKCAAAASAIELLLAIPAKRQEHAKLKSAIRTTHGGALRDLGKLADALQMGAEAHALQPHNFRPCTLLGALNIELGNIEEGHNWYLMAEARGAKRDSIEHDLRSLLLRMSEERRKATIVELLKIAPREYDGLRQLLKR